MGKTVVKNAASVVANFVQRLHANKRIIAYAEPKDRNALVERHVHTCKIGINLLGPLEAEHHAEMCDKIFGMPWPEEKKKECISRVNELAFRDYELEPNRTMLQDFRCLEHFLPKWLWEIVGHDFGEKLVEFLVTKLGCLHPY